MNKTSLKDFKPIVQRFFRQTPELFNSQLIFKLNEKFWELAQKLLTPDFDTNFIDAGLSSINLFDLNIGQRGNNLFLGYFSSDGLAIIFEKYHLREKLEKKGFKNLKFRIITDDPYEHRMIVCNKEKDKNEKLIELVIKREYLQIKMPFKTELNNRYYQMLAIEWLMMQNPRKGFSKERPRLPSQEYPGLGIASEALELLIYACRRLGMQGIINIPNYFHNALFYSRIFHYENPTDQAKLLALIRDTQAYKLIDIVWAIEDGALIDHNTGKPFIWFKGCQVFPLVKNLNQLYQGKEYKNLVKKQMKNYHYSINKSWKRRTTNED